MLKPNMATEGDTRATQVALLLAATAFLVPALGATTEALLQDTLKSMLVALFAMAAALLYCRPHGPTRVPLVLHPSLWFSGVLLVYAVGSTFWSHAYLASVEAIRWFIFSLVVLVGSHALTLDRTNAIIWGVHLGAVSASLWAAGQFWFDLQWFAQGPNPASTFVNRNFFAEFAVTALPFSVLLLTRLRDRASVFLMAPSVGLIVVAILMTGTRSALLALLVVTPVLTYLAWRFRGDWHSRDWSVVQRLGLIVLLVASVVAMGSLPTRNPRLLSESVEVTALGRALSRSTSLVQRDEYTKGSITMRRTMWSATGRMVAANPVFGVGAGAWEVHVPSFQNAGQTLETDYYAHNEFFQLVAEYGIAGWLALLGLLTYLTRAAYQTLALGSDREPHEALLRAGVLTSLLALLVVSCTGFPWRMAATGFLFALNLSLLAASDQRLPSNTALLTLHAGPFAQRVAFISLILGALVAVYISAQAALCESKLTHAIKLSLQVRRADNPQDRRWDTTKDEILDLARAGIAINPHYRKLTPLIGDAFASWGDWAHAVWIWESVLRSRPYIVGMMMNIARGHLQMGDFAKAQDMIDRVRAEQPDSVGAHSLEVVLWSRQAREREAAARAIELLRAGTFDRDLVQTAYVLGRQLHEPSLAILALEAGIRAWPERAVDGWLKLGDVYASPDVQDEPQATACYRMALQLAPPAYRAAVRAAIPLRYRERLQ